VPFSAPVEVQERPLNPRDVVCRIASGVSMPMDDAEWGRLLRACCGRCGARDRAWRTKLMSLDTGLAGNVVPIRSSLVAGGTG
jgi:hypothetical protein